MIMQPSSCLPDYHTPSVTGNWKYYLHRLQRAVGTDPVRRTGTALTLFAPGVPVLTTMQ